MPWDTIQSARYIHPITIMVYINRMGINAIDQHCRRLLGVPASSIYI